MVNWIMENPVMCVVIAVIAIALIVLIIRDRRDVLRKSTLYIVSKVEEEWGTNMGQIKFAEAYEYLKHQYPIVTFFIPKDTLSEMIEEALVRLKEILASKESKECKEAEKNNE